MFPLKRDLILEGLLSIEADRKPHKLFPFVKLEEHLSLESFFFFFALMKQELINSNYIMAKI